MRAKSGQLLEYLVGYGWFIHPDLDGVKLFQHPGVISAPAVFAHTEETVQDLLWKCLNWRRNQNI